MVSCVMRCMIVVIESSTTLSAVSRVSAASTFLDMSLGVFASSNQKSDSPSRVFTRLDQLLATTQLGWSSATLLWPALICSHLLCRTDSSKSHGSINSLESKYQTCAGTSVSLGSRLIGLLEADKVSSFFIKIHPHCRLFTLHLVVHHCHGLDSIRPLRGTLRPPLNLGRQRRKFGPQCRLFGQLDQGQHIFIVANTIRVGLDSVFIATRGDVVEHHTYPLIADVLASRVSSGGDDSVGSKILDGVDARRGKCDFKRISWVAGCSFVAALSAPITRQPFLFPSENGVIIGSGAVNHHLSGKTKTAQVRRNPSWTESTKFLLVY